MKKNVVVISILVIIIFGIIWLITQGKKSGTTTTPSSTTGIVNDADFKQANEVMKERVADEAYQSSKVGELLDVVPYKGTLFEFDYSYQTGKFTVTLQQGQLPQANAEFDAFLKEQGVESQDWIEGLEVKLQ